MNFELARVPYLAGRAKTKISAHLRAMRAVHAQHKHVLQQLLESSMLRFGATKVKMSEYIAQAMYSNEIYPDQSPARFGGWWFKEYIHSKLNDIRWEGMVTDKLIFYSLLESLGLPYPKIHAVAWQRSRTYGKVPVFHEAEKLAQFLRNSPQIYPLFCKPVKGSYARGSVRIEAYRKTDDTLLLSNGTERKLMPFLRDLEDGDGWGFLFQDAVIPHEQTKAICGAVTSGCRVVMLLDDKGASPYKIVWKIPAGNNHIDNFNGGAFGNMAAAVDVNTGRVTRVVSGTGVNMKLNRPHPDTGYRLAGTQIPDFEELIRIVKRAAEAFPGFRWQHWDVGITANGPVLYELNSAGNTDLIQIASGQGIYDERLKEFMDRYGDRKPVPGKLFDS